VEDISPYLYISISVDVEVMIQDGSAYDDVKSWCYQPVFLPKKMQLIGKSDFAAGSNPRQKCMLH